MSWLHLCQVRTHLISFDTTTLLQNRLALAMDIMETYLDGSSTDAVEELFPFHAEMADIVAGGQQVPPALLSAMAHTVDNILGEEPFTIFKSGPFFVRYLQWKVIIYGNALHFNTCMCACVCVCYCGQCGGSELLPVT